VQVAEQGGKPSSLPALTPEALRDGLGAAPSRSASVQRTERVRVHFAA
jgi:hypothetical protein